MDLENYNVKTEIFEGPLDVLLGMVEKRKLFINDISLSKVADDYIAYVNSLPDMPIGDTAQFILIASTLVLIKSKSLLPTLDLSMEEEQSIDDLENRLKIHQRYKELGLNLKKIFGKNLMFLKSKTKIDMVVFAPDKKTNLNNLLLKIKDVLARIPTVSQIPKTLVKKVISLEEAIVSLTDRISRNLRMNFREASKLGREERVMVIVTFLAMLELVKQGIIHVRQDKAFHDIEMETAHLSVPKY